MSDDPLQEATDLAAAGGRVLLATADRDGVPHLATAGRLVADGKDLLVQEWFCPTTLRNATENRAVSVTVWDEASQSGHQIISRVVEVTDREVLDGSPTTPDPQGHIPQVQRELRLRVERVLAFHTGPHRDEPEQA